MSGGDEHDEEGGQERWLVSYADFMTLLFAFFTVLYATSEKNSAKTEAFQESVKRYLIKAGGAGMGAAGPAAVNQGDLHNTVIEPPIKSYRDGDKAEAAARASLENVETFVEELSPEDRRQFVSDLTSDEWGIRLVLPSRAVFSDRADRFKPGAMAFLNRLATVLEKSGRRIMIEGHVAAGEVGGTRSTWDFASARAVNLLRFVQKSRNLKPGQLMATSYADGRPAVKAGATEANSRVEIVMLNPDVTL